MRLFVICWMQLLYVQSALLLPLGPNLLAARILRHRFKRFIKGNSIFIQMQIFNGVFYMNGWFSVRIIDRMIPIIQNLIIFVLTGRMPGRAAQRCCEKRAHGISHCFDNGRTDRRIRLPGDSGRQGIGRLQCPRRAICCSAFRYMDPGFEHNPYGHRIAGPVFATGGPLRRSVLAHVDSLPRQRVQGRRLLFSLLRKLHAKRGRVRVHRYFLIPAKVLHIERRRHILAKIPRRPLLLIEIPLRLAPNSNLPHRRRLVQHKPIFHRFLVSRFIGGFCHDKNIPVRKRRDLLRVDGQNYLVLPIRSFAMWRIPFCIRSFSPQCIALRVRHDHRIRRNAGIVLPAFRHLDPNPRIVAPAVDHAFAVPAGRRIHFY